MTLDAAPILQPPHSVTGEWHVLPGWVPIPDHGKLPVNAFLLAGREPMLVDTSLAVLSEAVINAIESIIDPANLRFIWLSHTDADHIGNLDRILSLAPKAKVITSFHGAGKMGLLGVGDPDRLRLIELGEVIEIAGRRLHAIRPPYYDAPETIGFFDEVDQVLFTADAFGALLPGLVERIEEVSPVALRDGIVAWSSIDSPWLSEIDRGALDKTLRSIERQNPTHVLSGHLPVAHCLEALTSVLRNAYGQGPSNSVSPDGRTMASALLA